MENENTPIAFDRKLAAQKLGISVVTLDRELAKQRVPHFRVGRRVLFTDELIAEYIALNTKTARRRFRPLRDSNE